MLVVEAKGDFDKTKKFLSKMSAGELFSVLEKYGAIGVAALASATPVDSGLTASLWDYTIERSGRSWTISWSNSNVNHGVPIAIILQYGHGTKNGGFVPGIDYINPAMAPIFEQIANDLWNEVKRA